VRKENVAVFVTQGNTLREKSRNGSSEELGDKSTPVVLRASASAPSKPNPPERCCGIFGSGYCPNENTATFVRSTFAVPQVEVPFAGFAASVQISSPDFLHFPDQW